MLKWHFGGSWVRVKVVSFDGFLLVLGGQVCVGKISEQWEKTVFLTTNGRQ